MTKGTKEPHLHEKKKNKRKRWENILSELKSKKHGMLANVETNTVELFVIKMVNENV